MCVCPCKCLRSALGNISYHMPYRCALALRTAAICIDEPVAPLCMARVPPPGVLFAFEANKDPSSPLYSKIDESRVVVSGHSMGATDSIEAERRLPSN